MFHTTKGKGRRISNNDKKKNNTNISNNTRAVAVVRTSSYVREATEWMALLQNLTSMMLASSSISHTTENARWSVRVAYVRADSRRRIGLSCEF
jgi:hypothetical protein